MQYLRAETLADFDGGLLANHVNKAFRACQLDLQDRPGLKKKRSVTITFEMEPEGEGDDLAFIKTKAIVKQCIPNKETRTNFLQPREEGMGFEADTRVAKFDAAQATLPGTQDPGDDDDDDGDDDE